MQKERQRRKEKAHGIGPQAKSRKAKGNEEKLNGAGQAQQGDFLTELRPRGPWLLVAIDPNKNKGNTTAITAHDQAEALSFIERWNGKRNLYYTVNPTRQPMTKKPAKTDIAAIEYMLADLDPAGDETPAAAKARYLAQLETLQPTPTAVIDSGNGLNVLCRLTQAIPLAVPVPDTKGKLAFSPEDQVKIADVEARCKAMMQRLGSRPGPQPIDRRLRLPGPRNLPTKAKRAARRVPCATALLWFNGATCTLDDFPLPDERKPKSKSKATGDKHDLSADLRRMLFFDDHGVGMEVGGYPSRSHLLYAFVCAALRKGIDENVIIEAVLDSAHQGHAIYAHVMEQGGEDCIKRQIEKAANELPTADEKGRTLILVEEGKLDETWRATQDALIAHACPIYVRGNKLVQPVWRWGKS